MKRNPLWADGFQLHLCCARARAWWLIDGPGESRLNRELAPLRRVMPGIATALLAVFLLYSAPATMAQSTTPEHLIAVVPRAFPPHYQLDEDGHAGGFAVDVLNGVAKQAGFSVEYTVEDSWVDVNKTMRSGRAHVIPNVGITPKRREDFLFTVPMETFRIAMITRDDAVDIRSQEDLSGRTVAVVTYNVGKRIMADRKDVNLREFPDVHEAFFALLAGDVDALVYPQAVIERISQSAGLRNKIKIVGEPLREIKRGMAVRKDAVAIHRLLDAELQVFLRTPEFREIYAKWFGVRDPGFWTVPRVAIAMAVLLVLIALWHYFSLLRLTRSLSRAIAEREASEGSLRASNEMLQVISDAQLGFLAREDNDQRGYQNLLRGMLDVTQSEHGFIGELEAAPFGQKTMKILAVENCEWSLRSRSAHQVGRSFPVQPDAPQSLVDRVLGERKPMWVNETDVDKPASGFPECLPELDSFLGVPFVLDGELVGMAALANRPQGYSQEQLEELRTIVSTGSVLMQAMRQENLRTAAESALRMEEERLRQAVLVSNFGIFEHDHETDDLYWSSEQRRIFGVAPDETMTLALFLEMVYPQDFPTIAAAVESAHDPDGDGRYDVEHRIVDRKGQLRWIQTRAQTFFSEDSNARRPVRTVGATVDITERKLAEATLAERAEVLARSNADLAQFAFVASHDLQEPLRKVQAFGDLLRREAGEALTERGQDYLARMQSASLRMQRLIQDLLMFSKASNAEFEVHELDLREVVNEVIRDLDTSLAETQGRIELGELPVVIANRIYLNQLLQNLIGNSLKYAKPGVPPVVRVEARVLAGDASPGGDVDGSDEWWEIRVIDNGIGFEQKHAERIFGVFQRLHGRGEASGTGIGLSICRKIVERLGGTIHAQSSPGQGTTVIFTMRAHAADNANCSTVEIASIDTGARLQGTGG